MSEKKIPQATVDAANHRLVLLRKNIDTTLELASVLRVDELLVLKNIDGNESRVLIERTFSFLRIYFTHKQYGDLLPMKDLKEAAAYIVSNVANEVTNRGFVLADGVDEIITDTFGTITNDNLNPKVVAHLLYEDAAKWKPMFKSLRTYDTKKIEKEKGKVVPPPVEAYANEEKNFKGEKEEKKEEKKAEEKPDDKGVK